MLLLQELAAGRRYQLPAVVAVALLPGAEPLQLLVVVGGAWRLAAAAWRAVAWRAVVRRTAAALRAAAARAAVAGWAPAAAVAALGSGSLEKVHQETPPPWAGPGKVSAAAAVAAVGAGGPDARRGAAPRTAALAASRGRAGLLPGRWPGSFAAARLAGASSPGGSRCRPSGTRRRLRAARRPRLGRPLVLRHLRWRKPPRSAACPGPTLAPPNGRSCPCTRPQTATRAGTWAGSACASLVLVLGPVSRRWLERCPMPDSKRRYQPPGKKKKDVFVTLLQLNQKKSST